MPALIPDHVLFRFADPDHFLGRRGGGGVAGAGAGAGAGVWSLERTLNHESPGSNRLAADSKLWQFCSLHIASTAV